MVWISEIIKILGQGILVIALLITTTQKINEMKHNKQPEASQVG